MMLDVVGLSFIPLYRFFGPVSMLLVVIFFIIGALRICLTLVIRAIIIARTRGCGVWVLAAVYGTIYHVVVTPMRWADDVAKKIAHDVEDRMIDEAERPPEEEMYPMKRLREARDEAQPLWSMVRTAFDRRGEAQGASQEDAVLNNLK